MFDMIGLGNLWDCYYWFALMGCEYKQCKIRPSFTHKKRKHETTLSKYIWELKDSNIDYTLSWKMFARTQPFTQVTGLCQLCTREKFFIIFKPDLCTLNSRNELLSSCHHKRTNLLIMQNRTKKKKTRNRGR